MGALLLALSLMTGVAVSALVGQGDPMGTKVGAAGGALSLAVFSHLVRGIQWSRLRFAVWSNAWLLALSAWGLLSALWSPQPTESLFRSASFAFAVLLSIVVGQYVAGRGTAADHVNAVLQAGAAVLSLLLAAGFLRPDVSLGFTEYEGGRRLGGQLLHPNTGGALAGLVLTVGVLGYVNRVASIHTLAISATPALVVLAWTMSRGGMMSALLAIVTSLTVYSPSSLGGRRRRAWLDWRVILLGVVAAIAVGIVGLDAAAVRVARGQDLVTLLSLTGRPRIWLASLPTSPMSWIVGNGFSMLTSEGPVRIGLFVTYHAHSGYLQVLAGMGLVGILLLWGVFLRASRLVRYASPGMSAVLRGSVVYLLVSNLVEASFGFQVYPQLVLGLVIWNMAKP